MESTTQIFLRVQVTEAESSAVEGENLVGEYEDRVQIEDFNFNMKAKLQAPTKSPQKSSSNLDFSPLEVTKVFDRASLRFAALLKNSTPLYEVRVTVDQQLEEYGGEVKGKAQNAIIVFHLMQARLVDMSLNVSGDGVASTVSETLKFTFKNFAVEYYYKGTTNNKRSDYRDKWLSFETEYKDVHEQN
jgi:type VI protein secretion system component Hcp